MELLLGAIILIVGQAMLQPPTVANPITMNITDTNVTDAHVSDANLTNVDSNATFVNSTATPVCNNKYQHCCREFAGRVPNLVELYSVMSDSIEYLKEIACTNQTFKDNVS